MKKIFVAFFLWGLFISTANASLVTFDDVSFNTPTPFVTGGFLFSGSNSFSFVFETSGGSSDNGTQALIIGGFDSTVTITKEGGGLFSVDSFDAGLSWYTQLSIFDVRVGNETITLGEGYKTYLFPNLINISFLTIGPAPIDGYIAIDNISLSEPSTVPEPGALLLLILGLVGLGLTWQRKTI